MIALCAIAFAKTWPMTESSGQKLADKGDGPANPGYIGLAPGADDRDAKMTGKEGVICNGKTTVTIPSGPFFSFEKASGFTMSIEVKLLEEPDVVIPGWTRYQIVIKGYDSWQGNWQLRLLRKRSFGPLYMTFAMHPQPKKYITFEAPVTLLPQQWYKFTVTMDKKVCKMYLNTKEIGSFPCDQLPPYNNAVILMGIYASASSLGFPMQLRNFTVEKKAVPPTASK